MSPGALSVDSPPLIAVPSLLPNIGERTPSCDDKQPGPLRRSKICVGALIGALALRKIFMPHAISHSRLLQHSPFHQTNPEQNILQSAVTRNCHLSAETISLSDARRKFRITFTTVDVAGAQTRWKKIERPMMLSLRNTHNVSQSVTKPLLVPLGGCRYGANERWTRQVSGVRDALRPCVRRSRFLPCDCAIAFRGTPSSWKRDSVLTGKSTSACGLRGSCGNKCSFPPTGSEGA